MMTQLTSRIALSARSLHKNDADRVCAEDFDLVVVASGDRLEPGVKCRRSAPAEPSAGGNNALRT